MAPLQSTDAVSLLKTIANRALSAEFPHKSCNAMTCPTKDSTVTFDHNEDDKVGCRTKKAMFDVWKGAVVLFLHQVGKTDYNTTMSALNNGPLVTRLTTSLVVLLDRIYGYSTSDLAQNPAVHATINGLSEVMKQMSQIYDDTPNISVFDMDDNITNSCLDDRYLHLRFDLELSNVFLHSTTHNATPRIEDIAQAVLDKYKESLQYFMSLRTISAADCVFHSIALQALETLKASSS